MTFYLSWGLVIALSLSNFNHEKVLSLDEIRSKRNRYVVYAMIFGVSISLVEMYLKIKGDIASGSYGALAVFCIVAFCAVRYDKMILRVYLEKNPEGCFEIAEQKNGLLKGVYKVGKYVWPAVMYTNKTIKEKVLQVKMKNFTKWHREVVVEDIYYGVAI